PFPPEKQCHRCRCKEHQAGGVFERLVPGPNQSRRCGSPIETTHRIKHHGRISAIACRGVGSREDMFGHALSLDSSKRAFGRTLPAPSLQIGSAGALSEDIADFGFIQKVSIKAWAGFSFQRPLVLDSDGASRSWVVR